MWWRWRCKADAIQPTNETYLLQDQQKKQNKIIKTEKNENDRRFVGW